MVNNGFLNFLKNTDQNKICVYNVLKAKTEKIKYKKSVDHPKRPFLSFEIKTINNFFFIFFFCLALKTIDAQMLLRSVFLKTHKKTILTAKNGQNVVFDGHYLFCEFSKILTKRKVVHLLFLKLNQSRNTKKNLFGGFLQKPKMHFFGGPKWYFLKVKFKICISAFVF